MRNATALVSLPTGKVAAGVALARLTWVVYSALFLEATYIWYFMVMHDGQDNAVTCEHLSPNGLPSAEWWRSTPDRQLMCDEMVAANFRVYTAKWYVAYHVVIVACTCATALWLAGKGVCACVRRIGKSKIEPTRKKA